MKTFTLDEAQALLPIVESLLNRAIEAKRAAGDVQEEMAALVRRIFMSGGMFVDIAAAIFPACWKARRCCCAGSGARRASTSGIASRTGLRAGSRLTRGFGGPRRKS